MSQDARIATHEIQFSPGGTAIGVEVGRDCSKVVPISELRMDKTKTAAKRSLGFLGPKKSKGSVNVLGAEAEAKMAERKRQREKLRELRERNVPMDVMEEDENDGRTSPKKEKGKSPRRAALGSLDSNSPVISWTEQLAEELGRATEPQASPAKQRPIGCSQSPLSSPKMSGKGGTLEERYGGTEPLRPVSMGIPTKKKKSKKRGFGFGRTNRRGEIVSDDDAHGAALAVEALRSKDPLRQSFLLRTIQQQQEELRLVNEAAAQRMALLEEQYQAQMEENTRKLEEEAKKAAAAAAAELAQEVLGPMAAKAAAAQATVADTAGQGIKNYADPDWLEKYMGTATPEQMDAYISANLSSAAPAVASLKAEHEAAAAKNAAAAAAAKEAAEAAELAAKAEEQQLAAQIATEEAKATAGTAPETAEAPAAAQWEELKTDSGDSYYYNSTTQETTWDRPASLGPAAPATSAPAMANAVTVAVTVQNVKSKLWSLLDCGDFEDMVESNPDDDTVSSETPREEGSNAAASSVMTADRSLLNLCIKSELQAGRSNLRTVPDVARSPNGTPVRTAASAGWDQKNNLTLRLESDPQFENMREALARRFNEVGSVRSEMDSVRSDWSEGTSNWTPRE